MKIVVKSTKTISFDENFDDDGSSSENKSQDSNKDSEESKLEEVASQEDPDQANKANRKFRQTRTKGGLKSYQVQQNHQPLISR